GDIKNAVLKAAAAAAAESGADVEKAIALRHFEAAMEQVVAAHSIMQQSVFTDVAAINDLARDPLSDWRQLAERWRTASIVSMTLAVLAFLASMIAIGLVYVR